VLDYNPTKAHSHTTGMTHLLEQGNKTSETLKKKTAPRISLERLLEEFLDFLPLTVDPVSANDFAARSK